MESEEWISGLARAPVMPIGFNPEEQTMRINGRVALVRLAAVAVVAMFCTWAPPAAQAILYPPDEIYVDAIDGDDVTGTGTSVAPFRTISRGLEEAGEDDKVFVRAGLYDSEPFPIAMKEGVSVLGIPKTDASGRSIPVAGPDGLLYNLPVIQGGAVWHFADAYHTGGITTLFVSILGADYGWLEHFVVFVRNTDDVPAAGLLCDSTHPFVRFNTFKGYGGDPAAMASCFSTRRKR